MNILIIEAYTDANIGSGALVENSLKILKENYPSANLRVMAHHPKAFHDLCAVDAVDDVFKYPFGQSRPRQVLWLLWSLIWMPLAWVAALGFPPKLAAQLPVVGAKLRHFIWADIVVSVGAERINDKFFKNIVFSLYTYDLIFRLGKRMIIFPSTIGPFIFGWTRWLSSKILRNVDLIYTRDDLSEKTTKALPGISSEKVINTVDVAVLQGMIPRDQALQMIHANPDEKLVGISVMEWSYFKNKVETPYSNYPAYVREMANFADTVIDEFGVSVILYPTNYPENGCRENDVKTAFEVKSQMKSADKVRIIDKLPTPSQFKGMLACSEMNVTTRMHACILSTGAFVPTVSVNYLFKLAEYMNSLGLGDYSIDIEEFCAERALAVFREMWPQRAKWREHLKVMISEKQTTLHQTMELLNAVVQG